MNAKGAATRLCHGDTVMDKALPVLGYGEVWQRGGFTCTSEQAGMTCFNADRRGFSLARAKQEVVEARLTKSGCGFFGTCRTNSCEYRADNTPCFSILWGRT